MFHVLNEELGRHRVREGTLQWRSYIQMKEGSFYKKGDFSHPHLEVAMPASRSLN